MSAAYKCDRCSEFFEGKLAPMSVYVQVPNLDRDAYGAGKTLQFCKGCCAAFEHWMSPADFVPQRDLELQRHKPCPVGGCMLHAGHARDCHVLVSTGNG